MRYFWMRTDNRSYRRNIEFPAPDVDSQGRSIETAEQHIRISADNNIKKTKQIVLSIRISGDKATDMIYFPV